MFSNYSLEWYVKDNTLLKDGKQNKKADVKEMFVHWLFNNLATIRKLSSITALVFNKVFQTFCIHIKRKQ